MRRSLVLLVLVAAAAGCGGSKSSAPPPGTTTGPTSSVAKDQIPLIVYRPNGVELEAARVSVPRTRAVARAALQALGIGVNSLRIADGTATVDLADQPSGLALAQLVFTLTEFPTVKQVAIGDRTLTRTDLDHYAPPILVAEPQPGDAVASPVRVHGNADTFEATFQIEVVDGRGKMVAHRTVTATSGSGERGSFDVTIPFADAQPGEGKIVAYENSAENGQRIHVVEIPVVLS